MDGQVLILSAQRDYTRRLKEALKQTFPQDVGVLVELDPLRAMQLNMRAYSGLIIDHIFDEIDGLQLLRLLRGLAPDVKCVVVSDLSEQLFSQPAFASGAELVFLRPQTNEQYLAMAEELALLIAPPKRGLNPVRRSGDGTLHVLRRDTVPIVAAEQALKEAPPLDTPLPEEIAPVRWKYQKGQTELPNLDSRWKVSLTGELVEGMQMPAPERCAFITYFFYRKLADIAIALEVDYFTHMTLYGPHLQQVLVADNWGIHHAVFETAWATEAQREQFVKWSCEQSL